MHKYCVDVTASVAGVAADNNLNRLVFALDAIASIHGGKVLEPTGALTNVSYHCQCVDPFDCEDSIGKELDWLRKEFPNVLFGPAEMIATGRRQSESQPDPTIQSPLV